MSNRLVYCGGVVADWSPANTDTLYNLYYPVVSAGERLLSRI